ncbi:IQ-domain [Trifolium repens]|nr:IQ-domain [Trifolium repens]
MGKASKWIRNLLLGKKEDNLKQIDTFCSENKTANTVSSSRNSSSNNNKIVVKRKWSFRKLTSGRSTGKVVAHKISKSFDSVDSPKLQIQALMFQTQTPRTAAEFVRTAATRIQASFRSYLARRALHALRGLVKLQALVRGHLVRKQTTATLRGMHALMSIQVRARIKRIKMAEEVIPPEISPPQHTESPCFQEYMTQPKQHQLKRLHSGSVVASAEELPLGIATSAFDGTQISKWEEPNGAKGCWIVYRTFDDKKYELVAYELMSANDAPERDPMDWILEGSNDDGNSWQVLDKQTSQFFKDRFQRKTYMINSASSPSNLFRFRFLAVKDIQSTSRLQIGSIDLYAKTL